MVCGFTLPLRGLPALWSSNFPAELFRMPLAMIARAELPVHMNRPFEGPLAMSAPSSTVPQAV